ncbi:[acyl-carrier-protein] S-malonyltransferase [Catenulispora sp. MAP5-51]|uniref:peptidylprolyl isomerase n=1 Tax=Catenulispora sp. MAP5-51 TaxID=3156298 RepID=UPI0035154E5B
MTHSHSPQDPHPHPHPHHSDAAEAARAQREATVIGAVAGTPIPRERLDARVRELRTGRLAGRLPAVGSKEDRQFLRWTAQVQLTEELCRVELARLGPESATDAAPRPLTHVESLHLGSINAAAWARSAAMSALYDLVTDPTPAAAPQTATRTWYRVTHSVAATPLEAATAPETSLGWTTLDDLPATLAAELRARPSGTRVGPVRTGLGWHFATVTATETRPDEPMPHAEQDASDPARLAAFNRWLDERRSALVTNAPGFEHPGDPGQADNTHRH